MGDSGIGDTSEPRFDADGKGPSRARAAASSDAVTTVDDSLDASKSREERGDDGLVAVDKKSPDVRDGPDANKNSRDEKSAEADGLDANKNLGDPRDARVVVNKKVGASKRKKKNQNDQRGAPKKKNHAWQYSESHPPQIPSLMVGGYRLFKEELDQYVAYCQERPTRGSKQLCHMCIFDSTYFANTFTPRDMLKHCSEVHGAGIQCTEPDCGVRVPTERERFIHIPFCQTFCRVVGLQGVQVRRN